MSNYIIKGGNRLKGEIKITTCKNAILPIMAGSILCKGKVELLDCPMYVDVQKMIEILKKLGSVVNIKDGNIILDNTNLKYEFISNDLTKDIRASIFCLGPMLSRFGKAKIAYPGGCAIGKRGIDIHKDLLEQVGVELLEKHGYMVGSATQTTSKDLFMKYPSVGATENIMMYLAGSNGTFTIHNVAREPEIVDLAHFLNKMGAKIKGAGKSTISIVGVKTFRSVCYKPIPDRIIAGTMLIAGAMTKGNIKLTNCKYKHIMPLIKILKKSGCKIKIKNDSIKLMISKKLSCIGKLETNPYPNFATDLQSQIVTMASISRGTSVVKENVFDNRFRYVEELSKMGGSIEVYNNIAVVQGVKNLYGADVEATDLRGGVSLVLASLVANGYSTIHNVEIIDRGYYNLENILTSLGADIKRI